MDCLMYLHNCALLGYCYIFFDTVLILCCVSMACVIVVIGPLLVFFQYCQINRMRADNPIALLGLYADC